MVVGRWIKNGGLFSFCGITGSARIEYKIVKNSRRFRFASLKDHQLVGLLGDVYWKMSDLTPGEKPCDALWVGGADAVGLLVVGFWDDGRKKNGRGLRWYVIDVRDYVKLEEAYVEDGKVSVLERDLAEISLGGEMR